MIYIYIYICSTEKTDKGTYLKRTYTHYIILLLITITTHWRVLSLEMLNQKLGQIQEIRLSRLVSSESQIMLTFLFINLRLNNNSLIY